MISGIRSDILAILEDYTQTNPEDISRSIAADFRRRRIEKNLTRSQIAERSGVALSNIVRFEQKGLISLTNLIALAIALNYVAEVKQIFSEPKFSTMEELTQIRRNANKQRAHKL
jgi:transcriptional regulator with XRE-family HTH domain